MTFLLWCVVQLGFASTDSEHPAVNSQQATQQIEHWARGRAVYQTGIALTGAAAGLALTSTIVISTAEFPESEGAIPALVGAVILGEIGLITTIAGAGQQCRRGRRMRPDAIRCTLEPLAWVAFGSQLFVVLSPLVAPVMAPVAFGLAVAQVSYVNHRLPGRAGRKGPLAFHVQAGPGNLSIAGTF